jgi:hypothetical protein
MLPGAFEPRNETKWQNRKANESQKQVGEYLQDNGHEFDQCIHRVFSFETGCENVDVWEYVLCGVPWQVCG